MNRNGEYPVVMGAIVAVCATGAGSSVVPAVEHLVGLAVLGAGLGWLVVVTVRREWRIRARLVDPRTRPAPRTSGGVPVSWVGPGAHAPAPPAPTIRPGATRDVRPTATAPPTGGAR